MTGLAEEVISDRDIQGIYKALFNNLLANPLRASWLELDKPIYAASILVQLTHATPCYSLGYPIHLFLSSLYR